MADEVVQERAKTFLDQGQAAARAGQRELARRYLQAAVDIDPDNVDAWLWLAGVQDDPRNVKQSLERVIALDPNNRRAKQGLALVEEELAKQDVHDATFVEAEESAAPDESIEQALRAQLRRSSEQAEPDDRGRQRTQALAEPADSFDDDSSFADFFSSEDILYRAITLALVGLLIIGIIILVLLLLGIIAPIA